MKQAVIVKDTNPKDAIGSMKVPLHLVSPVAKAMMSTALFLGMVKYGAWNWRKGGARASVYLAALDRHMDHWKSGTEFDDDGTHHLANALACLAILIEAQYLGKLVDDRPPSVPLGPLYAQIEKQIMPKILERYGHMTPRHWNISDDVSPQAEQKTTRKTKRK